MDILVVGSGGREHTLVWKIAQSPSVGKIYCAPGNAGTAGLAENVGIKAGDIDGLISFAKENSIGLTVVGPEDPLVDGLADRFSDEGLRVFGPMAGAAQLEGSKAFAKEFMAKFDIPTAKYGTFTEVGAALAYLDEVGAPIVVKASGLAAGKGAIVCMEMAEAKAAVEDMFGGKFGNAGAKVVIEEFMEGEEASLLVFADGSNVVPLESAQDHKRAYDGDEGPNTGGMGAYSPAPVLTKDLFDQTMERIVGPTIKGMQAEGTPYKGILYVGLMITTEGPKVVEYNCRFGDPEVQVVLMRFNGDILEVMEACIDGGLDGVVVDWDPRPSVCVVMASGGYPGSYDKGKVITGLDTAAGMDDVVVFHAGTAAGDEGVMTSGGRVLGVTALGGDIAGAVGKAYEAVGKIDFEKAYFRKDIAHRALNR